MGRVLVPLENLFPALAGMIHDPDIAKAAVDCSPRSRG